MAAEMKRTRHPGIYKRGSRYVVVYLVHGKQKKESARTLDEALRMKRSREADRDRGEFQAESRIRFKNYAEEWVERYQGKGRKGFRESTRDDYRRDLRRYAYPFFDERLGRTISSITPRDVANWVQWLCEQDSTRGGKLKDASVRRIVSPLRACLGTARREGIIRHNPADGAAMPYRPNVDDSEPEKVRAFTREQLATVLRVVNPEHRTLFRFLAESGVRWSEAIAVRWSDLELNGSHACVKVRRAYVRGVFGPPKSKHGRRDVPLSAGLVFDLRRRRSEAEWSRDEDLVFGARNGAPLRYENVRRRVLAPAVEEAGAPWAGFHAFRHSLASMLFERGKNAVQVQRWLGHHSAAFTLDTYIHLLDDDQGEAIDLSVELSGATEPETLRGIEQTSETWDAA